MLLICEHCGIEVDSEEYDQLGDCEGCGASYHEGCKSDHEEEEEPEYDD